MSNLPPPNNNNPIRPRGLPINPASPLRRPAAPAKPSQQPSDNIDSYMEKLKRDGAKSKAEEKEDQFFNSMFEDESETEALKVLVEKGQTYNYKDKYAETEAKIKRNRETLRIQYPAGGLKGYQFIDYDVLKDAPADFFFRYEDYVKEVTVSVQNTLSEKGLSQLVGAAQANPFDAAMQDEAFRSIQGIASEKLESGPYKGIERQVVLFMVATDIMGLSRIEPLWRDKNISEIICNGPNDIQVETKGKLYKVPSCQFRDHEHLEQMLERIFSTISKTLSATTPYLDGRLYDQSRIAATHRRISPAGPNVAIRRHPDKWWTAVDLINYESASEELFTDVGNWIYKGCSYIVIGGTSSGKTSLLNATSGFYHPEHRILTLEDNLEMKLHPGKLIGAPMEVVPPNPHKQGDRGISMRELVKACLRMRPDGIVIGEVRDGAMYDLCQALNTGHWGASTVHANSPEEGIYRMQSLITQAELIEGDGALPLIASAFDFIIMQEHFPQDGSRKITSVSEIDPFPTRTSNGLELGVTRIWEFQADAFDESDPEAKITGHWEKVGELSEARRKRRHLDLTKDLNWEELVELASIPPEFIKDEEKD